MTTVSTPVFGRCASFLCMDNISDGRWAAIDQLALKRLAFSILGSREAAEDVVQDSLAKYAALTGAHMSPLHTQAWLMRTTRNAAIDRYRRQQTESRVLNAWAFFYHPKPEPDEESPEAVQIRSQLRRGLLALLLLNATEREVAIVLLRDVFEMEFKQLARYAGISDANCRQLVGRVRKRIKLSVLEQSIADCVCTAANPLFEEALVEQRIDPLIDYLKLMSVVPGAINQIEQQGQSVFLSTVYRRGRITFELQLGECILCPLPAFMSNNNKALA